MSRATKKTEVLNVAAVMAVAALLFLSAPGSSSGGAEDEPAAAPLTIVVQVKPTRPRVADELTCTLAVRGAAGVTPHEPSVDEAFAAFRVLGVESPITEDDPAASPGRPLLLRRVYRIAPRRSGELTVGPFRVSYRDTRFEGEDQLGEVVAGVMRIAVVSELEPAVASLEDLALDDLRGPTGMAAPRRLQRENILLFGGGLIGLAVALLMVFRSRPAPSSDAARRSKPPAPVSWSAELIDLIPERDQDANRAILRAALIVRRYVERAMGGCRPDQTTEEFFDTASAGQLMPAERRHAMRVVLQLADRVKFGGDRLNRQQVSRVIQPLLELDEPGSPA